jgi:hypothetical protein
MESQMPPHAEIRPPRIPLNAFGLLVVLVLGVVAFSIFSGWANGVSGRDATQYFTDVLPISCGDALKEAGMLEVAIGFFLFAIPGIFAAPKRPSPEEISIRSILWWKFFSNTAWRFWLVLISLACFHIFIITPIVLHRENGVKNHAKEETITSLEVSNHCLTTQVKLMYEYIDKLNLRDDPNGYRWLGGTAFNRDDFDSAVYLFKKALNNPPPSNLVKKHFPEINVYPAYFQSRLKIIINDKKSTDEDKIGADKVFRVGFGEMIGNIEDSIKNNESDDFYNSSYGLKMLLTNFCVMQWAPTNEANFVNDTSNSIREILWKNFHEKF